MSANQADDLQRLNYFNGQRLAAGDFRAEQAHHLGMRRVLNRSLYSRGIVVGLEVETRPADKHKVIVREGLAFDHLGREIFVPQDLSVQVMGAPSTTPGVVFGNLLTVSYREQRRFPVSERCAVVTPYKPCSGDLPWGAPTRIAADAVFEFLDSWPADDSGRVVLGAGGAVQEVRGGARAARGAQVRRAGEAADRARAGARRREGHRRRQPQGAVLPRATAAFRTAATLILRSRAVLAAALHRDAARTPTRSTWCWRRSRGSSRITMRSRRSRPATSSIRSTSASTRCAMPATKATTAFACGSRPTGSSKAAWKTATCPGDLKDRAHLTATNTLHHHTIAAGQQTNDAGAVPDHTHRSPQLPPARPASNARRRRRRAPRAARMGTSAT